jgi:hypothetical protein
MIDEEKTQQALSVVGDRLWGDLPAEQKQGGYQSPLALNVQTMREIYQIATAFSMSNLVPEAYRGRKDSVGHANCFVALTMGFELNLPPMQALTHIVVVNGRPAIDGQLAIALANRRAPIVGPIRFDEGGKGDEQFAVAWVMDKATKQRVEYKMTIAEARAAGWLDKNMSHWKKDPKIMLRYRAASYLIRTNYPDALMGMTTREELDDMAEEPTSRAISERLADE